MSGLVLAALFAVVALLYAMVGFGGGSSYNALLVLAGTDYQLIPVVALTCNIIVVAGGVWHFARAGHLRFATVMPFALGSVPLAVLGGALIVPERVFVLVLGWALVAAGLVMLWPQRARSVDTASTDSADRSIGAGSRWLIGLPVGGALGLLAGVVGIGGGIFLAPLMHLLAWDRAKVIAASASVFILINSLAGLAGQLSKWSVSQSLDLLAPFVGLPVAVLLGGQLGSYLGAGPVSSRLIKLMTAVLVLYVAARLLLTAW